MAAVNSDAQKPSTIRVRKGRGQDEGHSYDKIPWTASRSYRLLRPLASRLLQLPRHQYEEPQCDIQQSEEAVQRPRKRVRLTGNTSGSEPEDIDPDWRPGIGGKKPIKWKYSSRHARRMPSSFEKAGSWRATKARASLALPGEVIIATPLIARQKAEHGAVPKGGSYGNAPVEPSELEDSHPASCSQGAFSDAAAIEEALERRKFSRQAYGQLISGLKLNFGVFLKSTALKSDHRTLLRPPRRGSRSLMSTCLRQVPDYMLREEKWQKEQDEDTDIDVPSEVYTYLEGFSSSESAGWLPLREVVRAHGVHMICEAIRNAVMPAEIAATMAVPALHRQANEEAQAIFETLVSILEPLHRPQNVCSKLIDELSNPALRCLQWLTDCTSRRGFQYQQLAYLLEDGILPVEWMATKQMNPILKDLVRSISRRDDDFFDAIRLLEAIFMCAATGSSPSISEDIHRQRLAGRRSFKNSKRRIVSSQGYPRPTKTGVSETSPIQVALNNTFSSMLTIITAMELTNEDPSDDESRVQSLAIRNMITGLCARIQQNLELYPHPLVTDSISNLHSLRSSWLVLAHALLTETTTASNMDPSSLFRLQFPLSSSTIPGRSLGSHDLRTSLASFITATARCCSRATQVDDFSTIKALIPSLTTSQLGAYDSRTRDCLRSVAMEAAIVFAESTGLSKHFAWAVEVEKEIQSGWQAGLGSSPFKTPVRSRRTGKEGVSEETPVKQFRWEESICEWVAKTPAGPLQREVVFGKKSLQNDSEESSHSDNDDDSGRSDNDSVRDHSPGVASQSSLTSWASTPQTPSVRDKPPVRRSFSILIDANDIPASARDEYEDIEVDIRPYEPSSSPEPLQPQPQPRTLRPRISSGRHTPYNEANSSPEPPTRVPSQRLRPIRSCPSLQTKAKVQPERRLRRSDRHKPLQEIPQVTSSTSAQSEVRVQGNKRKRSSTSTTSSSFLSDKKHTQQTTQRSLPSSPSQSQLPYPSPSPSTTTRTKFNNKPVPPRRFSETKLQHSRTSRAFSTADGMMKMKMKRQKNETSAAARAAARALEESEDELCL